MAEGDEGSQQFRTIGPLKIKRAAGELLETTKVPILQPSLPLKYSGLLFQIREQWEKATLVIPKAFL